MILKLFVNIRMMYNIYKNIEEYNPDKKQKILIVFDDIIGNMLSNKTLNPAVTESFIRVRKLNTSLILLRNLILLYKQILD